MRSLQFYIIAFGILLLAGLSGCVCSQCPSCCSSEARYNIEPVNKVQALNPEPTAENLVKP